MALDWTGIIVEREFYSEHYLKSVLEEDLRPVFARWSAAEKDSPVQAVVRAGKEWHAAKAHVEEEKDADARRVRQREWLVPLLTGLGYSWQPDERPTEDGAIVPIVGEVARAKGQPDLWLLEALDVSNELADPLSLPIMPGDASEDPVTWEDLITERVFSGPEPPRWVLLFHLGQLVLLEGNAR